MFRTDTEAGLAHLTGWPLELGVGALTGPALAHPPAVADLPVRGQARGRVQGTVTGTASVVGVALAHTTLAHAISWD